ncbi:MAG TPA: histidine phosphatase family protein [Beijerinckiaceae bacterium]|nr:histidine phosphatase family protein [Beijerinckiaceae bacterium]
MTGPAIYFIRHGETDWNREGRLQGGQEIPLNDLGRSQAAVAAEHLRDLVGERTRTLPWLASPMGRTVETLQIMRRTLGLPAGGWASDERLREISFGRWEGLTWKEVRRADPPGAAGRSADKWGYVPPGGESYQILQERVRPVFEAIVTDTIVVAHGGVARAALVLLAGMAPMAAVNEDIWQGRVLVIEPGRQFWVP